MLALGSWIVLQQQLSPGAMIAGSILIGRALAPVDMVIGQWGMVQRARRGHRDIKALLSAYPEPEPLTELPRPEARLTLTDATVIFRPGERPTLEQVNLEVKPGEVIGVIGRSGSGKSTLARVMAGLVAPIQGDVRLAGASLSHYGPERLGRLIGYLPQDIQFFDATIAVNISQLDLEPDSAGLVAAAQKARVHDIIQSLPDGYDTLIGPDTTHLSGGQKQRLALARALYRDPVMLILDEPNSALDAEGSEALNQTVETMKAEGKSVFIMTHRPAAIRSCDTLVILEKGRISANGPRDEVIRSMMTNADRVKKSLKTGAAHG